MEKRETINHGYSWTRFILIPVILALLAEIIYESENRLWNILYIFVCYGLFRLLHMLRKLKYDKQNLYIIRAKKETSIPFEKIISIKKSNTKVNSERYWKLTYMNEDDKKKTLRYFLSFFSKDFNESVQAVNPSVIIWTHPHFNH